MAFISRRILGAVVKPISATPRAEISGRGKEVGDKLGTGLRAPSNNRAVQT